MPGQRGRDLDPGLTALRAPSLLHTALCPGVDQELILTCPSQGGGFGNTRVVEKLGKGPQMAVVPQEPTRELAICTLAGMVPIT